MPLHQWPFIFDCAETAFDVSARRSSCLQVVDQAAGTVEIVGPTEEVVNQAKAIVLAMIEDPEPGRAYLGVPVAGVEKFGIFVEFLPGQQGLVHVSELGGALSDFSVGDNVDVKLLEVLPPKSL